jgi:hypothetical protein
VKLARRRSATVMERLGEDAAEKEGKGERKRASERASRSTDQSTS